MPMVILHLIRVPTLFNANLASLLMFESEDESEVVVVESVLVSELTSVSELDSVDDELDESASLLCQGLSEQCYI